MESKTNIIRTHCYPRVGLIGNPSDGYFGKTLSFVFANFQASVVLYESPELEILPSQKDHSRFEGIDALARDVKRHGYYGGIRLVKATIKRFYEYCQTHGIELHEKNFTIRYESNIPHGVGLAGSSAIIIACLRALMGFYNVPLSPHTQSQLALEAEARELHIPAGLQDRVVQAYEGLVYMNFSRAVMKRQGYGHYETMDRRLLPKLYVAYCKDFGEPTEVVHSELRRRYDEGVKSVRAAMEYWANLAAKAREILLAGRPDQLGLLVNANYDRRAKVCPLNPRHVELIEAARRAGVSAKFTGSGRAITGTYQTQAQFDTLRKRLRDLGVAVIKPRLVGPKRNGSL